MRGKVWIYSAIAGTLLRLPESEFRKRVLSAGIRLLPMHLAQ